MGQHEEVCVKLEAILRSSVVMTKRMEILEDRLFKDNGDCLQSKVNKNTTLIRALIGGLSAVGAFVVAAIGWLCKITFGG